MTSINQLTDQMVANMEPVDHKYFMRDIAAGETDSIWVRKQLTDLYDLCIDSPVIVADAFHQSGAIVDLFDPSAEGDGQRTELQYLLRAEETARYCKTQVGANDRLAFRVIEQQMNVAAQLTERLSGFIRTTILDRVAFHVEQHTLAESA